MKKNIFNLLDEATDKYVPNNFNEIMDGIEFTSDNKDLSEIKTKTNQIKNRRAMKYSAVSAAACIIVALCVFMLKDDFMTPSMDTTVQEEVQTSLAEKEEVPINTANGLFIPAIIVYSNKLYVGAEDTVYYSDLDKEYLAEINGRQQTIYSLKGKSLDSIVLKIGQAYYGYYKCVYEGTFRYQDKEYGLKEPLPQEMKKGRYIGKSNGFSIYEVVGEDSAIIVDIAPLFKLDCAEQLYIAQEL